MFPRITGSIKKSIKCAIVGIDMGACRRLTHSCITVLAAAAASGLAVKTYQDFTALNKTLAAREERIAPDSQNPWADAGRNANEPTMSRGAVFYVYPDNRVRKAPQTARKFTLPEPL
jgi:uncharacterized membrane protein YebE (DUF533 family)